MRIEPLASPQDFEEWCNDRGIELVAKERPRDGYFARNSLKRWYITTERGTLVEIVDEGMLTSTHGNGDSPEEALVDYARQLRGQRVRISLRASTVREYSEETAPSEWIIKWKLETWHIA
jgi:hypothetical protein